jgi:hypothetical protein
LDDGRALVLGQSWLADDLWALDLATGERSRMVIGGTVGQRVAPVGDPGKAPAHTADGRRILSCAHSLTTHRAGDDLLTPLVEGGKVVGSPCGAEVIILNDDHVLERVDLLTGARERLFPPR